MNWIRIGGLWSRASLERDCWLREEPQPLRIDISVAQGLREVIENDKLRAGDLNYSKLAKAVKSLVESRVFMDLATLARAIAKLLSAEVGVHAFELELQIPKASLMADAFGYRYAGHVGKFLVKGLGCYSLIGIKKREQEKRQRLTIDYLLETSDDFTTIELEAITFAVQSYVSKASTQTIEALAAQIADVILECKMVGSAEVTVSKPKALAISETVAVTIRRTCRHDTILDSMSTRSAAGLHMAFIGIGSSRGGRVACIDAAMQAVRAQREIAIVDTSFMYETVATCPGQSPSLNVAIKIGTALEPLGLLAILEEIEQSIGEKGPIDDVPRTLELDILAFDEVVMKGDKLVLPHPKITEREFVLRPFKDIASQHVMPGCTKTIEQLLTGHPGPSICRKVMPIGNRLLRWGERTLIMGILNVTPDSFSDGGLYDTPEAALRQAGIMVDAGVDIIDVGGQSTRPGAEIVGAEEEGGRVLPVIEAIRREHPDVLISIDTFNASVAEAAVRAGANMINDVCAGRGDQSMFDIMAQASVPVCLMHSRGDPKSMNQLASYDDGSVLGIVKQELAEAIEKAIKVGVNRWNIVVDPGFGFAKLQSHSVSLFHGMLKQDAPAFFPPFPSLFGVSRKLFVGHLIGRPSGPASARDFGSAAAVTTSVACGADIVRVHNVLAMRDVVRVADGLWRTQPL